MSSGKSMESIFTFQMYYITTQKLLGNVYILVNHYIIVHTNIIRSGEIDGIRNLNTNMRLPIFGDISRIFKFQWCV